MANFENIDWDWVRGHYRLRVETHMALAYLHQSGQVAKFASLAVGEDDASGNYSASEHQLGPRILRGNPRAEQRVFDLAAGFLDTDSPAMVPMLIRKAQLKFLQIGVGSEISCMMKPSSFWVANKKSIWAHLVVKHDSIARANEALKLYTEEDVDSEMAYQYWAAIHAEMKGDLEQICKMSPQPAETGGLLASELTFLWADAISCNLFDVYHSKPA
jgi:hypothetical protein